MIRRLIILLLIFGCDNSTESEDVHPLVGVWEGTELKIKKDGLTIAIYYLGENSDDGTLTYIFGADGIYSYQSATTNEIATGSGTWSSTGGKLTLIGGEETIVGDCKQSDVIGQKGLKS